MIIPTFCFGNKYDAVKQDSTFRYLQEYSEIMKQQLPIIEERMKQIDSDLVESYKDYTDVQKVVKYNNYLAEKTFNDYKTRFMNELYSKLRPVHTKSFTGKEKSLNYEHHYWLDDPVMDTEQCNGGTYKAKDYSREEVEKELKDQREHTCLYPDNYEEFYILLQNSGDDKNSTDGLYVRKDSIQDNTHTSYSVVLNKNTLDENPDFIENVLDLVVSVQTTTYMENHIERNNWQQDIKEGMRTYKEDGYCRNGACRFTEIKDMSKWRSGNYSADYKVQEIATGNSLHYEKF